MNGIAVSQTDRYMECTNCYSTRDVLFITLGELHTQSFKLCSHCAGELSVQLDLMKK
ncbi:hypothetical protein SAMN05192534_12323 [Alteribacillus persepolensis]|uniref:Uncharacterized protein n=1 Tax=Alteribacillus persepolensis TaxID=568899 RepID=A0A1G8I765_9BACI|nr:hypothetical protein SAMN05192534_12323 [Alteribacillus persepolensis]